MILYTLYKKCQPLLAPKHALLAPKHVQIEPRKSRVVNGCVKIYMINVAIVQIDALISNIKHLIIHRVVT